MRLFWRRRPRGKHALGAAVIPLPAGPPVAATAPGPAAAVEPDLATLIAQLIASGEAWNVPLSELPPLPLPVVRPEGDRAASPRVQLGFRDGTSTSLDPSSSQSLALERLAQSLTSRD